MDGILPLWKERGMTSHDCVFKLRKILKTKKVGHTGTLDPEVDGVLPICIGKATKVVEFLTDTDKAYEGEITIGVATTTEDSQGETIAKAPVAQDLSLAEIDAAMEAMVGESIQVPPMYSAVKVNGKRLYEYARKGLTVERPQRSIHVMSFERISEPVYHAEEQTMSWSFRVTCGKGTYVRTLAVDLGASLGYPAYMSSLTRTMSGSFTKDDCLTLQQVAEAMANNEIDAHLKPIDSVFETYHQIALDDELWDKVKNGAVLPKEGPFETMEAPVLFTHQGKIVAMYEPHPTKSGFIKPRKMFLS
ncbi:tRNA pseudouridine(55) synthase TruB [Trichococcus sp. K1Tr]|uniref:tRNA pseudouridine(55) synthase TruB n=1 Tax=Trichococcus sp. K1Tr TaxID=3020847 RepID=UPI00232FEAE7|nr:tRNA pseudouridine(55) synthase TruB [Trichococcus sp. K1Tr]MDB6352234.1 tRNA pseudouridine(55) synthase TruB [Trichococcus sp. K1Tr]